MLVDSGEKKTSEYMKDHIFELRREIWNMIDHRSYSGNLSNVSSCEKRERFEPMTSEIPVQYYSQGDLFPVNLIAQLLEHCTSIAEIMGSNLVQAWIFFRL